MSDGKEKEAFFCTKMFFYESACQFTCTCMCETKSGTLVRSVVTSFYLHVVIFYYVFSFLGVGAVGRGGSIVCRGVSKKNPYI